MSSLAHQMGKQAAQETQGRSGGMLDFLKALAVGAGGAGTRALLGAGAPASMIAAAAPQVLQPLTHLANDPATFASPAVGAWESGSDYGSALDEISGGRISDMGAKLLQPAANVARPGGAQE